MSGPQSAAGLGIHLHTGTPLWKTKEILWGFFFIVEDKGISTWSLSIVDRAFLYLWMWNF